MKKGELETEQVILAFRIFSEAIKILARNIVKTFKRCDPFLRQYYLAIFCGQLKEYSKNIQRKERS